MPDFSRMILRGTPAKREVAMNAFRAKQQSKGRIDLLPPEPGAPAHKRGRRPSARFEVVDADFVVIRTGTARTSNDNRRPFRTRAPRTISNHLLVRAAAACTRLCETGLQLLSGRAFAGLVTTLFLFVFAYAGGLSALTAARPAAGSSELLRVAGVSAAIDDRNGMKVLSVYGRVDNVSGGVQALPSLEVVIDGGANAVQRRVALDAESLAAGASETFTLRIPHDGGKVPKVSVSLTPEGAPVD